MSSSQLSTYAPILWVILALVCLTLILWVLSLRRRLGSLEYRLNAVLGDVAEENTAKMLAEYLTTVRSTAASVNQMRGQHDELVRLMPSVIRHVGLVRFSPFHDTGGDQSFALALLDGRRSGVVVTALHSRTDSRLYAKPIEQHQSTYTLTPEEREAMARAVGAPLEAAHT